MGRNITAISLGVAQIALIVLKTVGVIACNWFWALSPLILAAWLYVFLIVFALFRIAYAAANKD